MTSDSGYPLRATSAAPLRGTQSLVGVMAFVFKHPSLTALELLWRWLAAAPLLYLAWHSLAPTLAAIPLDTTALGTMTFFEPVRSAAVLVRALSPFRTPLVAVARWWVPLALLAWVVAATLGRTAVLRRAEPRLQPRLLPYLLANLSRALLFVLLLAVWLVGLRGAVRSTITHPLYFGQEPNLVLLTAEAVALTLAAFLLWSTTVWLLDLQPLQRMTGLQTAVNEGQGRQLRSKLIETNLVMGIVRVILLVLSLTFSASPLPFQSRETQAYINVWWVGVAAFYLLSSDFFHVVRRVTYLRLLQSVAERSAPPVQDAS